MYKINPEIREDIFASQNNREKSLSEYACKTKSAVQITKREEDIRPAFSRDADRIIHSRCYSRYIDKTQVFYLIDNDHVSHRVLHVQLVSKIARTIGRFLNLNEDLIEAIALGHDVGHTPFGHNGEKIVSSFCQKNDAGFFEHNIQSFRLFHELENKCKGLSLSVQVLDGIICHNGELVEEAYSYDKQKTKDNLLNDYQESMNKDGVSRKMKPMTLEGCVVRISDIIAYIGRDIEDAEVVKLIQKKDIPSDIVKVLGNTNREIVNNLIVNLVNNSYGKDCLCFSSEVFEALNKLKDWNSKNIYANPKKAIQDKKIESMFYYVLNQNLENLEKKDGSSEIMKWIRLEMSEEYLDNTKSARIVADYVSGMTDDFLMNSYNDMVMPKSFGMGFGDDCQYTEP